MRALSTALGLRRIQSQGKALEAVYLERRKTITLLPDREPASAQADPSRNGPAKMPLNNAGSQHDLAFRHGHIGTGERNRTLAAFRLVGDHRAVLVHPAHEAELTAPW